RATLLNRQRFARDGLGIMRRRHAGSRTADRGKSRSNAHVPIDATRRLVAVPVDEAHHQRLRLFAVRAWNVAERIDTALVGLAQVAVLQVRPGPQLDEFVNAVVNALDRVL